MSKNFDELRRAVEIIARHQDFPGKGELVRGGLDGLDEYHGCGKLTDLERDRLRAILLAPVRTVSDGTTPCSNKLRGRTPVIPRKPVLKRVRLSPTIGASPTEPASESGSGLTTYLSRPIP